MRCVNRIFYRVVCLLGDTRSGNAMVWSLTRSKLEKTWVSGTKAQTSISFPDHHDVFVW